MKYQAYQAYSDSLGMMRAMGQATQLGMSHPFWASAFACYPGFQENLKKFDAALDVFNAAKLTHKRPEFGISHVQIGEGEHSGTVAVREEMVHIGDFCSLLCFKKEGIEGQPRVLLVAPLSGHFATLLRETVRTMLADHEVYITDWHNARDVPLSAGRFGLDEYTAYIIQFLEIMGPGAHLMAICQPCVAALAATSIMAEDHNPASPRSLTLMAGPIDCRVNPTKVNELATSRSFEWFERNLISSVPLVHPGAMRRVYPGFIQLSAFMSMNLERHKTSFKEMHAHLLEGDEEKAALIRTFYEEYFAVLDLPAEFYLETIKEVFQDYSLPLGKLKWRDRIINPAAIRRTALLTVEGERDDICALGQTMAAHDLCPGIPPFMKSHHMQAGVGHYGVFSGRRWNREIYPIVRENIYAAA